MVKSKDEQIFVQDGLKRIELTGEAKDAFIADRADTQAKQDEQLKALEIEKSELNKKII